MITILFLDKLKEYLLIEGQIIFLKGDQIKIFTYSHQ